MRLNYKKLGPYIREVSVKNKDLEVGRLLGVSITKAFITSIANTVGTDMSKYKIVRTNQFAYGPVTSRNGEKISVALLQENDCIISTSYTVFEVIDHEKLDPEYLMMWFRRPEFDRYARYKSHGSVREIFGWEDLCDVQLPIPPIEKQQEIVAEYNTIVNCIKLNEEINQKLEETAQAIYKQWFVDFEFPISAEYATSIGKPELEGKPYKSSGGEMVFCPGLDQEVPKGWSHTYLEKMADISAGGDRPKIFSEFKSEKCKIPIFSNGTTVEGLYGYTDKAKINSKSVTIAARGGIGFTALRLDPYVPIVRLIVLKPKDEKHLFYLFETAKRFRHQDGTSSAQSQLTVPNISQYSLLRPDEEILVKYGKLVQNVYSVIVSKKSVYSFFSSFLQIMNTKMARAA